MLYCSYFWDNPEIGTFFSRLRSCVPRIHAGMPLTACLANEQGAISVTISVVISQLQLLDRFLYRWLHDCGKRRKKLAPESSVG